MLIDSMGPKKNYETRAGNAREHRHTEDTLTITSDPVEFTLAVLSEGQTYATISRIFAKTQTLPPSRSTFYRTQKFLEPFIESEALESCARVRSTMSTDSCIAFDGSWSCARHAWHCFCLFTDARRKLCADFTVVSKVKTNSSSTYMGACQSMETEGLKRLAEKWINHYPTYPAVTRFAHDNDSHARYLLREMHWNFTEFLDPNHAQKCVFKQLDRAFHSYPSQLRELQPRLLRWWKFLIRSEPDLNVRLELWCGTIQHLKGDHRLCSHQRVKAGYLWSGAGSPILEELLLTFLERSGDILTKVDVRYSTNYNESVNGTKSRFAPKNFAFTVSFPVRCCLAVLSRNDPKEWYQKLRRRVQLTVLPPLFSNFLQRTTDRALAQRQQRAMPGAADAIREQRHNYRSFIYRSRNGKPEVVHGQADEGDLDTRVPASDWAFNIFFFDLAPKTARLFNVPKPVPMNQIQEKAEEVALVRSIRRIENLKGKTDCYSYELITSDEASASRIVAHLNGMHFRHCKARAVRPKLPARIQDESILLWEIPIELSQADLIRQFSFCGEIRDCRVSRDKSIPMKIAIIWFGDRPSVIRAIDPAFLLKMSPIQIIPARGQVTQFINERFDDEALVRDQLISGSEEEDYEIVCRPPQSPVADDDWTHTASPERDPELEDLSIPSFVCDGSLHPGIPNLGNTCYLSACLQALLHFPSDRPLIDILPDNDNHLIHGFRNLSSLISSDPEIALQEILCGLSLDIENVHMAQDASEVLRIFLNSFVRYSAEVGQLIETHIREYVFSQNSATQSEAPATLIGWDIPIESYATLESAISGFFAAQHWENEETGDCGTSQSEIIELPQILILTLKLLKFEGERIMKSNHRLPIQETLQLSMQVVGEESPAHEFTLHGIIAHLGSPEEGHYIYLSRQPPGNSWILHDDSYVVTTSISEIIGNERDCAAYILFYAKNRT
jgi:hypothetical protein